MESGKVQLRIGVFGSSSKQTKKAYCEAAFRLGQLIAENGHICVNGAGMSGVMGALNEGCRSKNGWIRGIIHQSFVVDAEEDRQIHDLHVTTGKALNERKDGLFDDSDCLIIMPGGVGTFDEFWDCVSSKSLNMKDLERKPICCVNMEGYYDGFITQIHRAHNDGVLYFHADHYFHVVEDVESAVEWCVSEKRRVDLANDQSVLSIRQHLRASDDLSANESSRSVIARAKAFTPEKTPEPKSASHNLAQQATLAAVCVAVGIVIGRYMVASK